MRSQQGEPGEECSRQRERRVQRAGGWTVCCRNSEEEAVWVEQGEGEREGMGQVMQGLVGPGMDFLVPRNSKLGLREALPPVQSHTAAEGQNLD